MLFRSGWALSQEFYREEVWRSIGYSSLEDFIVRFWEANFARRDPADLLAQLWTWQHGDISAHPDFNRDLPKALASIRAKVLLMPGDHDLYFRVEDNRRELEHLKQAELKPIGSIWGHRAGNPVQCVEDAAFIATSVNEFLVA